MAKGRVGTIGPVPRGSALQQQGDFGTTVSILFVLATCLKFIVLSDITYRSDDFEVHRNWIALTSTRPTHLWYYDETSRWTLDYPPVFAYFSLLLAKIATLVVGNADAVAMMLTQVPDLKLPAHMYITETKYFMAATVVVSDITLAIGTYLCLRPIPGQKDTRHGILALLAAAIMLNPGLLVVDNIHFQYNAALIGLLLTSLGILRCGGRGRDVIWPTVVSCVLFTVLVLAKHLYLVLAPAYAVYLLAQTHLRVRQGIRNITAAAEFIGTTAIAVLATTAAILWPFRHQVPQVLSRLFPFTRGLLHTHWAPNFWAFYTTLDRVLARSLRYLPSDILQFVRNRFPDSALVRRVTTALTLNFKWGESGPTKFALLLEISPLHCAALVLLFSAPGLIIMYRGTLKAGVIREHAFALLVRALVCCSCAAVLFGWHVHEKALMTVSILLPVLLAQENNISDNNLLAAYIAHNVSSFAAINYLLVPASPAEAVLAGLIALVLLPGACSALLMPRSQRFACACIASTCVAEICRVTATNILGNHDAIWQIVSALCATGAVFMAWWQSFCAVSE